MKSFEKNVSFVTIHGAGHMVPEFKPIAGLQLFKRVLFNLPLSPLVDTSQVESCTDEQFFGSEATEGYMEKWISEAQSSDYTDLPVHQPEREAFAPLEQKSF